MNVCCLVVDPFAVPGQTTSKVPYYDYVAPACGRHNKSCVTGSKLTRKMKECGMDLSSFP